MKRRALLAGTALTMLLIASGTTAIAGNDKGFKTSRPPMLTTVTPVIGGPPVVPGVQITPLLTVGDVLPGGFRFEAIPDGISLYPHGNAKVDVFVNHETSKVPFPYNPTIATTEPGESQNDFDNAQVSQLILDRQTAGTLQASFAISSASGFQRFCSNYLATSKEGFSRDILFTNEESPDYVFRQAASWPPPVGSPSAREAGLVIALDVKNGKFNPIYGMGRHNHENNVAIPGFDELVVLSGDDTFTSGSLTIPPGGPLPPPPSGTRPAQSQLYSYIAPDTKSLLDDEGDLWAFRSTTAGFSDYYDFIFNSTQVVTGEFIQVPKEIATGLNPDGSEMKAADVPAAFGGPFPPPPNNGSWQRDLRSALNPADQVGIDGPQWVLEYWSQLNNVFQFVRVEDIAYDKRPGEENVVYIVDSGRGSTGGPAANLSTNGRVWKMEFDPDDPTVVTSLTVFVEGDNNPVKTPTEVHQPDNIETTATGILLTEDPGTNQQFPVNSTDPNATTARLMYVSFSNPASPQVVAKVVQTEDEGTTDEDPPDVGGNGFANGAFPISPGNWGVWESSGIVDASAAFGAGYFLIAVQAHTLWVDSAPGDVDLFAPFGTPDFTYKREGGQLLLIKIPGI